jgi:hypothetical protein
MHGTLARIADWVLLYLLRWARPHWELPSSYWLPGTALTSLIIGSNHCWLVDAPRSSSINNARKINGSRDAGVITDGSASVVGAGNVR